ncbi:hypothetical protein [Cupriavidus taiwanensis]|uniref:hypothetical protein n=1 Tax=Cupriavidus taiwanensis TaxID=164546 RepID=UPI00041D9EF2|nr:hypothetical protein [Cupriavidus taiwanensis]SOZ12085.1 conserved protein of unknown function [Cupriavidus taiwanensis]
MKTAGSLLYGVLYNDQLHYDFELRLPTIADNIAAIEQSEGPASALRIEVCMLAAALTKLGNIPVDAITYDLLAPQLTNEDLDVLQGKVAELKKKRLRPSSASGASASPSSPSAESASPSPASGA